MSQRVEGCAVCGDRGPSGMSRVLVGGRALELCRAHVGVVVAAMPATFEDLRQLFAGAGGRLEASATTPTGTSSLPERRSPISRRLEDRRVFPPRPEGRRANGGRRASDPVD